MTERHSTWDLLVYIAKKDLVRPDGVLPELLPAGPEWRGLILELAKHGLLASFDRSVQLEKCEELLPLPTLELLQSHREGAEALAFVREQITSQVLAALAANSITAMPLKGVYLSQRVYACSGAREFADVDLATERRNLGRAADVLAALGLEPQPNHTPTFRLRSGLDVVFELDAFREQTKSRCRETYLLDIDEIWSAAAKGELFGVPVVEMRPEHLLIYLGLHLVERHYFEKLIWLRDFREVIVRFADSIDWEYLLDCARRWRTSSYTYFSLLLAQRLANAPIEANALERLRPGYPEARLFERALLSGNGPQLPLEPWSLERQLLSVLGDGWGRRTWAKALFPVHALMRLRKQHGERLSGRTSATRLKHGEAGGAL